MDTIENHFSEVLDGANMLDETEIWQVVKILKFTKVSGGTVWLFGNGGSHATAGHFANDLLKMCGVRAINIGDMASVVSAYGNDNGQEDMFSAVLQKMLKDEDCAFGISCSGNSPNVIRALEHAKNQNVYTLGMTGSSLHSIINDCGLDGLIHTPGAQDIRVQEDLHLMICHAIARSLYDG